jgi:elongation factor P
MEVDRGMATTSDFRKGMVIRIDNSYMQIVDFLHVNPGKGAAFVRSRLKDVLSGKVVDRTWRAGEKVTEVRIERRTYELLYRTESEFVVMDPRTYEQVNLSREFVGDAALYLVDNCTVEILFHGDVPLYVEPSNFVELTVRETDPGLKGDTASGGSKPATLETGLVIQVPLFVKEGDRIRVDTRTDSYMERVKN